MTEKKDKLWWFKNNPTEESWSSIEANLYPHQVRIEKEKLEYEILKYLNERNEEYNITNEVMKANFHSVPQHKYDEIVQSLLDKNYIGKKDVHQKGWTITNDGKKELNIKASLLTEENSRKALKNSSKALDNSNKTFSLTKFLSFIGSVIVIFDALLIYNQNQIMKEQNILIARQLQEQLKQDSIANRNYKKETVR